MAILVTSISTLAYGKRSPSGTPFAAANALSIVFRPAGTSGGLFVIAV
jgi:hypothetical protein